MKIGQNFFRITIWVPSVTHPWGFQHKEAERVLNKTAKKFKRFLKIQVEQGQFLETTCSDDSMFGSSIFLDKEK